MSIFKKVKSIVDIYDESGNDTEFDKPYLILLMNCDDIGDDTYGEWIAMKGRKTTFEYLVDFVVRGNYNLIKSHILSGNMKFGEEVPIYCFLRLCIEKYNYNYITLEELDQYAIDSLSEEDQEKVTEETLQRIYYMEMN